jgi:hypothetical protein
VYIKKEKLQISTKIPHAAAGYLNAYIINLYHPETRNFRGWQ